jgi:SAM-dependent methyltransferase
MKDENDEVRYPDFPIPSCFLLPTSSFRCGSFRAVTWYREWFGEEYLELYAHRNEAEARRQVDFLRTQVGPIDGVVLDLACGTGRHLSEMKTQGYRAVGCDLSYVLLRTGTREYGPLSVTRADMRDLPFCDGVFAGLVNFFTSFGYFAEEEENVRTIAEMSRVLRRGAPFLFDYLNMHREVRNLVAQEEWDTNAGRVVIHRSFDPAGRVFNKRISIGPKRYLERVRAYDLAEITALFASSDFAIDRICGDFGGGPFHDDSPRLIVVGKKR